MLIQAAGKMRRSVYRTTLGKQFFGEMSAVPTEAGDNDFNLPRRILKVSPGSMVQIGEIMVTNTGRKYLLADNGDSERETVIYKTFKLIEMDRRVSVTRETTVLDTLTSLPRKTGMTNLGEIDCVFEFIGQEQTNLRVERDVFRVITNFILQNGDQLTGGYVVRNAERLLGVTVATVSR